MQTCRHPWIIVSITLTLTLAMGCRGARRLGGLVRVTEDPTVDLPEVEPVPQRLATTQHPNGLAPRAEASGPSQASQTLQQATPHPSGRGTLAAKAPARKPAVRNKSKQATTAQMVDSAPRPAVEKSPHEAARSKAVEALLAANRRNSQKSSPQDSRSKSPAINKDSEPQKRVADNAESDQLTKIPPEVRAQAMRRLVSSVAKKADQTTQPHALDVSLSESLDNELPQLPKAKNQPPQVPPKRIAQPAGAVATSLSDDSEMDVVHVSEFVPQKPTAKTDAAPDKVAADVAPSQPLAKTNDTKPADTKPHDTKPNSAPKTLLPTKSLAAEEPIDAKLPTQPLTLPAGSIDQGVVQTSSTADQQKSMVRAATPSLDDESKIARAVEPDDASATDDEPEMPTPPLSLAVPAPAGIAAQNPLGLKPRSQDDPFLMPLPADEKVAAAAPINPDSMSDQQLYEILLERLTKPQPGEGEAEKSRRQIMARHLMVLAGNPKDAAEKMDGLSEQEQKYLHHQLAGLWKMIDPQGHPVAGRRFSSALPELREATKYLAAATDSLEVKSLAFCTEIESYGQVKTFPGNRFQAGQQVILYCEVENFTAKKIDEGFETHLQGSYDVFNADNEKVVSQLLPADQQVAGTYLRDYFIAYQMHLPKQLTPGTYRLQLTMEDVNGKKYGQASVPLEIAK